MTDTTTNEAALMPGQPCRIELHTPDAGAVADFYEALLGWTIERDGGDGPLSHPALLGGSMVANLEPPAEAAEQAQEFVGWQVSLTTADIDGLLARVGPASGAIVVLRTDVDESMSYAVVQDPDGVRVGVICDRGFAGPPPPAPGMPVWHEVLSRRFEASVAFYRDVFAWDAHWMEAGGQQLPYVTNGKGAGAVCGIGEITYFASPEDPPAWRIYFGVADIDAAAGRVPGLGGEVVSEPGDTPWGRVAGIADPQGARFMLYQL